MLPAGLAVSNRRKTATSQVGQENRESAWILRQLPRFVRLPQRMTTLRRALCRARVTDSVDGQAQALAYPGLDRDIELVDPGVPVAECERDRRLVVGREVVTARGRNWDAFPQTEHRLDGV